MRRGLVAAVVAVALSAAACGSSTPSAAPASASAPGSQPPVPSLPVTIPTLPPPASIAAASLPAGAGAPVRDPSLLAILPSSVGGIAVAEEPDSFAQALTDQGFVASVDRAAFLIAVSGNDLASGVVAHLRQGIYSDKMFADWRSSYDQGACAQSGGVTSHAEADNPGGTTYVTTCGGGLRVFHTYIAGKGVIVSIFSTGPADLGGQLMSGLKP